MTWTETAAAHIDNPTGPRHRCVLLSPRELHCLDCKTKLILPRDPTAGTPTPARYKAPAQRGTPMPAGFRERVWADLRHKRQQKETP